ncbi:MAG: DegT/DnrJ/EryC1/StrS family aminotransferase [Candidatus Thiodiazotropha sp.]
MLKFYPPSGSPIKTGELLYWIICNILFVDKRPTISKVLKDRFNIKYSYLFTTGRGAMTLLLRSLKQLPNNEHKDEVIIPAYTCYSVASSVLNAGLKIRLCDIDPNTLSYNLDQLVKMPFDNVLCIITANLYGIPNQLNELESIANSSGVYLVDDAAQSFDSKSSGRDVGTFGTAGLYSFDKGKNITSIEGGVIGTNNIELSEIIASQYDNLPTSSLKESLLTTIKVIAYYLFLNPFLYWLPASLPFLNLGKTRYEDVISIKKYSRNLAPLALSQLKRSINIAKKRVENGLWYKSHITESEIHKKIKELDDAKPVYLRYPVRITDELLREKLINDAKRYGITISYPNSINRLKEIEGFIVNPGRFEGAEQISEQLITLPTHVYINDKVKIDINKIINRYVSQYILKN